MRRVRRDAKLRRALVSDYGSPAKAVLSERKNDGMGGGAGRPSLRKSRRRGASAPRSRTVASLRPTKALTIPCSISVQEASRKMGAAGVDAALVTLGGEVCGIITDSDIARRVVAAGKNAGSTPVSLVMTGSPTTVSPGEKAVDALLQMVERHFRHLPVIRNKSSVVGILDIQRCLSDALRRHQEGKSGAAAATMSVGLSTTVESVVNSDAEAPFVQDKQTVVDAARVMARSRKTAVLVRDASGTVVGILTTKDVMLRVVAARLIPGSTTVARVMTPHPDTIAATASVGDALKQMRTRRYLHLPVSLADDDTHVVGLVDALQLCYAVFQPHASPDKENEGGALPAAHLGLRGVLEGICQESVGCSDSESVTGSVAGDGESRLLTPQRSRASSVPPRHPDHAASSIVREETASIASAGALAQSHLSLSGLESRIEEGLAQVRSAIDRRVGLESKILQGLFQDSKRDEMGTLDAYQAKVTSALSTALSAHTDSEVTRLDGLAKGVSSKVDALVDRIEKREAEGHSRQLQVIQSLTSAIARGASGDAAAGSTKATVDAVKGMLEKHTVAVQADSEALRTFVAAEVKKIEASLESQRGALGQIRNLHTRLPGLVRSAVAEVVPVPDGKAVERGDDAGARDSGAVVKAVKSELAAVWDIQEKSSKDMSKAQEELAGSIETMRGRIESGLTANIESRVRTRVETELVKVAGVSVLGGLLAGILLCGFMFGGRGAANGPSK